MLAGAAIGCCWESYRCVQGRSKTVGHSGFGQSFCSYTIYYSLYFFSVRNTMCGGSAWQKTVKSDCHAQCVTLVSRVLLWWQTAADSKRSVMHCNATALRLHCTETARVLPLRYYYSHEYGHNYCTEIRITPKINQFFLVPLRTFPENLIQIHP